MSCSTDTFVAGLFVKCFANPFHEERWLFREREKKTKRTRYPYGSLHSIRVAFAIGDVKFILIRMRDPIVCGRKRYVFSRIRGGGNNNNNNNWLNIHEIRTIFFWPNIRCSVFRFFFCIAFFFFFFFLNLDIFSPLILDFHIVNFLYYVNVTSYVNLFVLVLAVYIFLYHINNLKYVSDASNIFIVSSRKEYIRTLYWHIFKIVKI